MPVLKRSLIWILNARPRLFLTFLLFFIFQNRMSRIRLSQSWRDSMSQKGFLGVVLTESFISSIFLIKFLLSQLQGFWSLIAGSQGFFKLFTIFNLNQILILTNVPVFRLLLALQMRGPLIELLITTISDPLTLPFSRLLKSTSLFNSFDTPIFLVIPHILLSELVFQRVLIDFSIPFSFLMILTRLPAFTADYHTFQEKRGTFVGVKIIDCYNQNIMGGCLTLRCFQFLKVLKIS